MSTTTVRSDIEKGVDSAFGTYLADKDIKVTSTIENAVTNAMARWFNQHQTQILGSVHGPAVTDAAQELAEINRILRDAGINPAAYGTGADGVRALAAYAEGQHGRARKAETELKAHRAALTPVS